MEIENNSTRLTPDEAQFIVELFRNYVRDDLGVAATVKVAHSGWVHAVEPGWDYLNSNSVDASLDEVLRADRAKTAWQKSGDAREPIAVTLTPEQLAHLKDSAVIAVPRATAEVGDIQSGYADEWVVDTIIEGPHLSYGEHAISDQDRATLDSVTIDQRLDFIATGDVIIKAIAQSR